MKKSNWLKGIDLAIVGTVIVFLSQWFSELPSQATSKSENYLSTEKISELKNLDSLGLAYLQDQPTSLLASSSLMDSIKNIEKELKTLPEDIPLTFPSGTNSPIKFPRELSDEDDRETSNDGANSKYEYIGFLDSQGKNNAFTVKDASDMLRTAYSNNGNLSVDSNPRQTLIADAQNPIFQAKRAPFFAVFLKDRKTGKKYLRHINAHAIIKDFLNAALNGTLRNMATGAVINLI
jgi:hypothetical protein